jgi:DNA polymerase IIIc chi subunit
LSHDLEGEKSETEPVMMVADLVDPRNRQDRNIKLEVEIKRKLGSRVAEILHLIEKSKKSLERVQEMIEAL